MKAIITCLMLLLTTPALAAGPAGQAPDPTRTLDEEVQDLKQKTLALNRELFLLEEELLFPSNTQTAVFVSLDVGEYFQLDSVQLRIDDKEVANHLYTRRELEALRRGGVQRLHIANLRNGEHEITAFFTGKGPHGRTYKRAATTKLRKGLGPAYVELRITRS